MWESSIFYSKSIYQTHNYFLKSSFINKLYNYYIHRGYFNIISMQLVNMCITIFLVFLIIFLNNCINYNLLFNINNKTYINEIVNMNNFFNFNPIIWFIVISLITFTSLKLICLIDDILVYRNIKFFYNNIIDISERDIQSILWSEIIDKMKLKYANHTNFDIFYINNMITNKDNYMITIFDKDIIIINHLTSLMEWNIIFCILNTIFTKESKIDSKLLSNKDKYIDMIKKKLRVISLLNFIFMPFILIFIILYNIFNYGEYFYSNPESLVTRSFTRVAYWKFKHYNELIHNYDDRLSKCKLHATDYANQFPNKLLDTFSRFLVFVISSLFIIMMVFSILNQNILINLYIGYNKNILWFIGISLSIIAILKNFIYNKLLYNPKEHLLKVNDYIKLPSEWLENSNRSYIKNAFLIFFPYKIIDLSKNIFYTILVPFQLWSISFDTKNIINFIIKSTINEPILGNICKFGLFHKNIINTNEKKIKESYDYFIKMYPEFKNNNIYFESEYLKSNSN